MREVKEKKGRENEIRITYRSGRGGRNTEEDNGGTGDDITRFQYVYQTSSKRTHTIALINLLCPRVAIPQHTLYNVNYDVQELYSHYIKINGRDKEKD